MTDAAMGRARVLAALRGERVLPVPVGAVTQTATVSQMEELSIHWPDAHFDAELLAGLAAGARTLLGFETVRVPFDQTIEAELVGAAVDFGDETSICVVESHPLALGDPIPALPDLGTGRAKVVADAIAILRRRMAGDAAVIGGIVGPFTLAGQLFGLSDLLMISHMRPDSVKPYLDFACSIGVEYARRQARAGADAICVEDMSASLELTSPRLFEDVILPAQRILVREIPIPVILHLCGGNTALLDSLGRTQASALSLETRTDLSLAPLAGVRCVIGGVPPLEVLLEGSPDDVRRSSQMCLSAGVGILAPGCSLAPMTPTENVLEMSRTARSVTA